MFLPIIPNITNDDTLSLKAVMLNKLNRTEFYDTRKQVRIFYCSCRVYTSWPLFLHHTGTGNDFLFPTGSATGIT